MLRLELDCAATIEKKSVLPDENFKFVVLKIFLGYASIVLLFIRIYMPIAVVVLLDCTA
jgi:hypothetical protein